MPKDESRVVVSPPDGFMAPPGSRQISDNCRHEFEPLWTPFGSNTGIMVCLRCKARIRGRPERPLTFAPEPHSERMGY